MFLCGFFKIMSSSHYFKANTQKKQVALIQKVIYGQNPRQNTGLAGPKRHKTGFLKKINKTARKDFNGSQVN